MLSPCNLFANLPPDHGNESFEDLWQRGNVRVERIVSRGQATPAGEWYDQEQDEWVLLLAGSAGLQIEGQAVMVLNPGDYLLLPAHCRHRVEWTATNRETIWLAIHIRS